MRHKVKYMYVLPTIHLLHRTMNTAHGGPRAATFGRGSDQMARLHQFMVFLSAADCCCVLHSGNLNVGSL
jgi:hypothetical protein